MSTPTQPWAAVALDGHRTLAEKAYSALHEGIISGALAHIYLGTIGMEGAYRGMRDGYVDEEWARDWREAGELIAKAAEPVVEQSWPSGLSTAATVLAELPSGATLFVGSSNSVRDIDLAMSPSVRRAPLTVVANRGLAGIDGCVSTAIGIALAQPGRPAYALMGDLTFLHDSNGLLIGPHEPRPDLSIVVTNDDGGGIFTLLEPGEPGRALDYERVFGTPTGASIADICSAHGVRHSLAADMVDLRDLLRLVPHGISVIEVPVDRSGHRDLHAKLGAAAADALP